MKILNLTNFRCPDTIFMLKKNIRYLKKKKMILILTNDISTTWDIPLFCKYMKYKLIEKKIQCLPYKFLIQKI